MKDILAPGNRALLAQFAAQRTLLAFDYDGTLAPIVERPSEARMRPQTRALLREAARLYPTAVLTGRSRESAMRLLGEVPVRFVVGNHGLEWPRPLPEQRRIERLVAGWKAELARHRWPGVRTEDKRFSLTVHLRHAVDGRAARRDLEALAQRLPGCRSERGIEIVNLLAAGAPGKDGALRRLLAKTRCTHAIFLGDDVTDEAVFRLREPEILSVRVGRRKDTAARFRLASQRAIDDLLRALVVQRRLPMERGET